MGKLYVCVALAVALVAAGCQSSLNPAPSARQVTEQAAVAFEDGVRMAAVADAWQGTPPNLDNQLTPMLVTITNHSAVPVRISYSEFRLVSSEGRRFSALPPFAIEQQVTRPISDPFYPPGGFHYAPYLTSYFPGLPYYERSFGLNSPYLHRFGPIMRVVELPTFDMLQKALPEGVLQPGGRVKGFIYFEGVGPTVERVELRADFPKATSGERLTRLTIPFTVG